MTVERWLQSEGENDEGGPDEGRIDSIHVGANAGRAIKSGQIRAMRASRSEATLMQRTRGPLTRHPLRLFVRALSGGAVARV
jgi:hypothetical protein